jgi:phosphopantothenoylcysteine decarboxylase/phosphopantothenate--cysteine ligase
MNLNGRKTRQVLVGFAAETSDVLANAQAKLGAKHLDLVVANDVSAEGLGFEADVNRVAFVSAEGAEELPVLDKRDIARLLLDRVAAILGRRR